MASKFLKITNYHIRVEVSGKRVNHGVEVGLEIPLNYLNYILWRYKSYNFGEK